MRARFAEFTAAEERLAVTRRARARGARPAHQGDGGRRARLLRAAAVGARGLPAPPRPAARCTAWRSPRASWPTAGSTPACRSTAAARSPSSPAPSTAWPARWPSASAICASRTTVCRASSTTRPRASASATPRAAISSPTGAGRRSPGISEADALGRTDAELFGPAIAAPAPRSSDSRRCARGSVIEIERDVELHGEPQHLPGSSSSRCWTPRASAYARRDDGHRRHRAPPRAGRRGRGLALEVRVPGQHEPRDPHAAQRRDRDDRAAARHRPLLGAARVRADRGRRPARRCWA